MTTITKTRTTTATVTTTGTRTKTAAAATNIPQRMPLLHVVCPIAVFKELPSHRFWAGSILCFRATGSTRWFGEAHGEKITDAPLEKPCSPAMPVLFVDLHVMLVPLLILFVLLILLMIFLQPAVVIVLAHG